MRRRRPTPPSPPPPSGVAYYNRVIDGLLACGVSPMVTLYHFDLPQALQDGGGWTSPAIASAFDDYARFCFRTFGDRVKLWITLNEPYVCAKLGHEDGVHAPGLRQPGTAAYLAGHNMLRAHAAAWRSYDALFRAGQGGAVSLALNADWVEPLRPDRGEDRAAAERRLAFTLGWFAKPVFVSGDYPDVMRAAADARLPRFSPDEPSVLGTADFFALNYYTSRKVKAGDGGGGRMSMEADVDAEDVVDPSWPVCGPPWLAVVPHGLRALLKYIKVKVLHIKAFSLFFSLPTPESPSAPSPPSGHVRQPGRLRYGERLRPDGSAPDGGRAAGGVLQGNHLGSVQRYDAPGARGGSSALAPPTGLILLVVKGRL